MLLYVGPKVFVKGTVGSGGVQRAQMYLEAYEGCPYHLRYNPQLTGIELIGFYIPFLHNMSLSIYIYILYIIYLYIYIL